MREIEEEIVALQRVGSIESQKFLHLLQMQKTEIEDDIAALRVASVDEEKFTGGTNGDEKEQKTMLNGKQYAFNLSFAIPY